MIESPTLRFEVERSGWRHNKELAYVTVKYNSATLDLGLLDSKDAILLKKAMRDALTELDNIFPEDSHE